MPTCRRKRVLLMEPPPELLKAAKSNPAKPVFYLEKTGEIFDSYEAYIARMSFYRVKQFQCEVTGKGGLDYFQAIESERAEARTMHTRFSEPLKPAVLKAVQWQVMGRLDHLVEAVFERFKDRYFLGERVLVDLTGTKYYARVEKVYPPRFSTDVAARDAYKGVTSSSLDEDIPHRVGGDLKIPIVEADAKDDPQKYFYWVHVLELEKDKGHDKKQAAVKTAEQPDTKMVGSLMEVQCGMLSRDRLSFSKSILRRFIRDCTDRDAAVASPWTVKPAIATRYGVASVMPEETRQGVENLKKGAIDKRKKVWEDKDGPPAKKHKKMTPAQEEKAKALAAAEKNNTESVEKAQYQRTAKDEADRLAAEKKKKKPVRYPTEDLDIRLGEKEKKAGIKICRPIPSRTDVPFWEHAGASESFLMVWNFLNVYGSNPMHLSTFTLDEFEHAIRHCAIDPPCALLAEIHASLIYNLRTVPFSRHGGLLSLLAYQKSYVLEHGTDPENLGVTMESLISAVREVGNNWERVPMRFNEGRQGWEDALVGCLKDHATVETFPKFQDILTRLLFSPETSVDVSGSSSSRTSTPASGRLVSMASPAERYHDLPTYDRLAILAFMCNLAVSSKSIHAQMESSEEQLTALRKEKIEVNRSKKQLLEDIAALPTEDGKAPVLPDILMDLSESEDEGGLPSGRGKRTKNAQAKEREASRAKNAELKIAAGERRRLDEEINKIERRLEGIEREFRKLLGAVRVKPLGRDRFYNRIWWFDGMGSASLVGSGGAVQYGTGRLFIQGPSQIDMDLLNQRKSEGIDSRRVEEEAKDGMLDVGEWAVYTGVEEIDEFVAWLNPKGLREVAVKNFMSKWWSMYMAPGIRKRLADVNLNARLPEARRSTRTKNGHDIAREPYMTWVNRRAMI